MKFPNINYLQEPHLFKQNRGIVCVQLAVVNGHARVSLHQEAKNGAQNTAILLDLDGIQTLIACLQQCSKKSSEAAGNN